LPDRCAIRRVSACGDVFDSDGDDITATELTVDCQIEHGEVASATFDLEFFPDRSDMFGSQRRLCPGQLAFVPLHSLGRWVRIQLILHGHTPRFGYRGEKHEPPAWALELGRLSGQSGRLGAFSGKYSIAFQPKRTSALIVNYCDDVRLRMAG
jgi:hypothetical protein